MVWPGSYLNQIPGSYLCFFRRVKKPLWVPMWLTRTVKEQDESQDDPVLLTPGDWDRDKYTFVGHNKIMAGTFTSTFQFFYLAFVFDNWIFLKKKIISNWTDFISQNKVSSGVLFNSLTQVAQGAQSGSSDVENNVTLPINISTIMIKGNATIPKRSRWPVDNATAIHSMPWCHPDLAFPWHFTLSIKNFFLRKK